MAEEQQEMQEQVPMDEQGDSVPILVDRSKLTPQMRHFLTMSKMQSENAYKEEAAKVNSKNEFTKTFTDQAEYKINKAVHEATVDRNYKKGAAEAVENFKGHQNLGYDNPQMAHHAKNNEMLSDAYYKEDYEMDKDIVYFPMETSPGYVSAKKVKEATDDANYKAKAAENNQQNKLNLCETPVYQTQEALKAKVSNKAYTKDYEEAKINVHPTPVTHEMVASKKAGELTKRAYGANGMEAIRSYNNDASMLNRGDIQQAQKTQKQDDHLKREYRKEYEESKTKYEFEKALNDVPVIKQQILASKQADATNTTYGAGGKQSMERNEFTKTYCDTNVYKTNKAITAITRDSLYQAGKADAIKSFKGFQALDINQVPSFKQHMANQENLSNVYYTDDYENDKDLVYFPTNITPKYESDKKNAEINANYKTEAAKDAETHKFNLAESETYKNQKDVESKTRPKQYTEKWEQEKFKVIGTAVTKEMELIETLKKTKDSAYTEAWDEAKLNIHYPPDNPLMLQAKKSAKQASDIEYKKDYRENVLGTKSSADAEGDLEYVVNKNKKAITDDANYKKDAIAAMEHHKYAPEFCETEKYKIAKNITEITSDRYNTTKETLKNFQGWNTIRPGDNPLIVHHANNADQLNPYLYKEDYEVEKTLVDYPVHMSEHYQNTKNLKEKLDGYTEDYEKMKQQNRLDLTKTEKYINDEALAKNYRSDKGYKAKYEKEVQGHCIGSETNPQLEQLKALKPYQNDKLYQEGARELMKTTNVPHDAPEFELSKKRNEIRSDKFYKKNYEETKHKNIPGPIENYHDYKTQAEVKAITNDAAYKKKYNETVVTNSVTKEFCNTEQYKTNKNLKKLTSKANYSDFPETLAKYKGFQSIDTNEVPEFAMHARNADQLSQPLYKEDYNNDKDLVFFPVHMSEKYQQDKKLHKEMQDYDANYQEKKHEVNFNQAETEKYLQDKEHRAKTSDKGYKKDWAEKVQGTTVGTARTMEMELQDTLKITKDSAYKEGAKERMKSYSRSLQDPDYEQMAKSQIQRSDKDYKKDYNENVLGKNIGAPIEGHLDYYSQKKVKEVTQDAAYTADAKDRMRSFVLEPNAPFVRNAIDVQKQVNMASYRKSGKEAIDQFKGFQQLDIYKNPYLNRHIINSENLSNNYYKEEYEIDKDCVYFPYNTTEKYAADKKLHDTAGDLAYSENHKNEDWKHSMDLCTTEKYQQDAKLVAENQGQRYKAKYLEDVSKGRAGGKLVHTWEIDAMNMMKKVRDQAYTAGAKQIQRKYDLMLDDNKLSHLMKVQDVCNARLYKKDYNENTLGKGAADPGIAYPYYKEQAKLTEKMQANEYTREAKDRMEKPQNYVRWDELRRSRKVALQCKDSEYRKSFHEAVKSMKGFQQLDIFQNPYMSRHIVNAENASDVYYKEDYENNKDVVYFPVQITERFQDIKKIAEIEADYKTEAKKIQAKVTFDAASTEKYHADKALREKLGAEYTKNSIEINARPKGVDKTMDMERIEKLKIVQGTNYAAEAKRLAMKYGLTADDTKLANSLLSAKITSDRLYHEHYNKHVRGTTAQNPEIAYEIEVTRNKNAAKIRSDNEYQKDAKKLAQRNEYTKQKYSESEKARLVALQCNDSEYQKGKREAVNEFKGYMRMDASLHPVVTRGILVSEMQSAALYREDWEMEKDLIYYPLNMTPGYEQLKAADEYKSDANYRAKWEQDKIATKYNAALTEKYNNDLEIRKVQSDAFYRSEWNSKQRHEFKTPARTMEMDRFEPLRKLTNKAYALEAKKLGEKYGLVHDDITLRNLIAVGGITSQIAYKKAYNAEDLGKSSKADFYGYLPYVTQRDVKAATNDAAYTKDAKNIMKHNVVAQSNEELRARSVALSMKDSEYKKSMREAIETCKGFMRMDAHLHPVVQRGVAVNEIISNALYKEEWEMEKDAIYFPVQMTPGYETAITSTKQSSDLIYKSDYNASKHQNKYDPTVSEKYQSDKIVENARSDKTYRKDYEETKHQNIGIAVTSEMERAGIQRDLRDAKYSLEAKKLAMKYGLTHDDIKLKNLLAVGAICSERLYKDHYNKEVLGKSSKADLNGYPHIKDSFKLQKEMSKAQYEKKSKEILKKNNYAQFDDEIRARNMALSVKDSAYRSSMWKAIDEFKGFMRMDASSHPVVTRGILVAELMSDALYKEDYMLERDLIYYPVQITPGYESATNAQSFASDINYRAKYHETKAENKYNSTLDQRYAEIKTHEKARSDKTYKADYEATKHIAKGTPVTQEMERAAIMKEISDDKYKSEAKKLAMKYGLTCDDIKLANSLAVAKIASDKLYKKDYNENVLGASGKADLQGYPVYKDAKENNAKLNTKAYKKDAMKVLEKNNYAQFDDEIRAREVALYCNPDRYSQQRREVINDMKGFMRMDAAMHPVVTRGIEVAEMQSAALYREEWEIEKDLIYFPAQITPGYESAQDAYKFQSENLYRKKYKDDLEKAPVFNPVHTEKYQQDKETEKHRSDKHYKAKWDDMKEKGEGFSSVAVTMEMERAKLLEKTAMKIYGKEAKNVAMKYGLDAKDVTLTNLKNVQQLRSDILYKKKYNEEDLGKSSVADLKGYPHLEASNKLQKAMSKAEYEKDAKQGLTKNNYVQFDEQNRAEKMAYEVRGSNYRRQMWETINKYKGFQRMDAASHPIVAEGNRVNDIISQRNYIEDYLIDRNVIYYPVHMTPGYEAAMFAAKWQSNIEYDADYQENKMKNKYNMTETERYKDIQVTEQFRSDKNYQAKVKADFSAGKGLTSIKETPEMVISKALKPLRTEYMKEAKDLAAKYSLCAGAVEIAHALEVADVTSMALYKKDYNQNTLGKAAANPGIAYPFYDLCKEYQSQRSDKNYKGDLQKVHDKYTFMDSDECRRARAAALSCTPREYTKQREEVIKKYQGFQRMDAATHPIVLEGERVNNLISRARYLEDFIIEKESVFYPVHLTAGYENSINAQKLLSETEYKKDHEANKFKNVFDSSKTEKYTADKAHEKHRSDFYYKLEANKMFAEGKGFTEVAERFDINLSKELQKTQGDRYVKEAKEIAGKYGLAHDAMAITSAIAISDVISKKLYKKKYEEECLGTGAKNPAIAHPEYLHYRDVQAALNQSNYKAEGDKIKVKYTVAESNETLRARSVALQCTDKEYKKQRAEVINKYKGFQHMDAHNHPVVVEGERVNDIISHSKYIEDYLVERNFVYFPAHITPGYENAVAVNKFQSDIPYRKDYLENRAKNVYDVTTTERYADQKAAVKYKNDQYYAEEWNTTGKLKFTSVSDTPVQNLAKANSKLQRPNDYVADAKDIMSKYGLELQNLNLQESMRNGQHHKDHLYKEKYNKETKGKGGNYKGIDDVFDYKRAKENQFNLNEKNYRATGEEFNHKYTLVYDTPVQLTALKNQKNINHALYSKSKIEAIEKFKGFQRMDAATHPIVVEGERVNDVISHRKYIEDYLIDRNVIYYPVHMTPGYETAVYASKWQSNIGYTDDYQKSKVKNVYNQAESEQYKDAKARQAAIGQNAYGREWKEKLATSKQHTEIVDPTEVKLAKSVKPWIGKAAYIKAAKEIAAKHGLVSGDISLQHAAECKLKLSMKDYRQAYVESVQGVGGKYQSIDDLFIEKQAKLTQEQLSQKNYTAKDDASLHQYTVIPDSVEMQRVKAQAGLLNDYLYSASRRDCIARYKGFQNMDAHSHPVVIRGVEAMERISNSKYTEEWKEIKEMIYFPVQITPAYESAMQAYQFQSQLLYNKDYHKEKHSNVYNMCTSEGYAQKQIANKILSDHHYQEDYRKNKGKGFTEVMTLKEETAKNVQPQTSIRLYQQAAKDLMGKYHIDCTAMEVGHAMEMRNVCSQRIYDDVYNKEVKGLPSRFFHLTETYDTYKKNAINLNDKIYQQDGRAASHQYTFGPNLMLEHYKNVMKLMSTSDYTKSQKIVNNTFKAFSKLCVGDDMNMVRAAENARNLSDWRYKEEYLEERNYAYFPVHITPGYENALQHTKMMSDKKYKAEYEESKRKANHFRANETEHYIQNKDLDGFLSIHKYRAKYMADRNKGYKGVKGLDMVQENLRDCQKRLSNWTYEQEARNTMGKYNLDLDFMPFKLAKANDVIQSENLYRKAGKEFNTKYQSAGKDEFALQLHAANKKLQNPNNYAADWNKQKEKYTLIPDSVAVEGAKAASKAFSQKEYLKDYEAAVKSASSFKNIDMWPEDRFHSEVTRNMSKHAYQEEYLIDRECCFYPVHITPGYELSLEVNRFQSQWLYLQKYKKDIQGAPNKYKITESEKYAQDKKNKGLLDFKYQEAGKATNTKWQFTIITPVHEHQKAMIELGSESKYKKEAKQIMMKYDLPVQRIDIVAAKEARQMVSDYIYLTKHREEKGKSRLWNAAAALDGPRHKENQQNISEKGYKEAAEKLKTTFNIPVDHLPIKAAQEAAAACSNLDYKKTYQEAIKQCRAFTKLSIKDSITQTFHQDVKEILSDKKYKEEYMEEQVGWCIPEFDTPEYRRIKEQYDRGDVSDKLYKKTFYKNTFGKGLTDFTGPSFQHALNMKTEQSKICYEAKDKEKHKWASHMANQTPGAMELKEAQKYQSASSYKQPEHYMGIGAAVMSEETKNQLEVQHLASVNEYKQKYEETKHISDFAKCEEPIDMAAFKDAQKLQSENLYKAQHLKEDFGRPAELAMSVKLVQDRENQKLASEHPYKLKGEKAKHIQSYQNNLFLTPWAKYVEEMKHLVSDNKYKEEWNDEKSAIWVPYMWTVEYEHYKEQADLKNQRAYTGDAKKALSKAANLYQSVEQEFQKEIKKEISTINYGNKVKGVMQHGPHTTVADTPAILHAKEAQELASGQKYKAEAEVFNKFCALDPTGGSYVNNAHLVEATKLAKDANVVKLDQTYDLKATPIELKDDFKTQELLRAQKMVGGKDYKKEAIAEMHAVNGCSVTDTPWQLTVDNAQKYASETQYREDPSKMKIFDDGTHDIQKYADRQANLSDVKYREEYNEYWKGQVLSLPIPFDLTMESLCERQKLTDEKAYKEKAKEAAQKYLVVPDTPYYRHLKELAEKSGERTYKAAALHEMRAMNLNTADSFSINEVKKAEALKNNREYQREAKLEMSLNSQTVNKETAAQIEATKVSDKIGYYKDGKEAMKTNLQADKTLEQAHIKDTVEKLNDRNYKAAAKVEMHAVNCNTIGVQLNAAKDAQKLTDEKGYKEIALKDMQSTNIRDADNFVFNNVKQIQKAVSDVEYKNSDQFGGIKDNEWCFQFPDDLSLTSAQQTTKYQSDAAYKKQFNEQKGKVAFIAADTPEYARLQKMQEQYSDLKYRDQVKREMKDITFTPNLKEATKASEIASDVKYRKAGKTELQKNTQVKDMIVDHQASITKDTLRSDRDYKQQYEMEKSKFTALPDDIQTTHRSRVQKIASKIAYQQENKMSEYSKLERTYDQERHDDNQYLVSSKYKQKTEGKSLDMVPSMEAKLEFQSLASKIEYSKNKQQDKNSFKPETTQMYNQLKDLKSIQSDVLYKKKAREGMDKNHATSIENRPDIAQNATASKLVSDKAYKEAGKQGSSGYTFVPEAPIHQHHNHAGKINSELHYKREGLKSQKGKGWEADEANPFQQTYMEAQRFTSGRNYKTAARDAMKASCYEDDFNSERVKKANRILSDREYKKDFEKTMKGYGYDLHMTPAMEAIRKANAIKSDKEYKKQYENELKGRSAGDVLQTPAMKAAMAAQQLMKKESLGEAIAGNDKWVTARVSAILDTPEMRRIKGVAKTSERNYRIKVNPGATVLDTPEMRRIKNVSKIQSKVAYADNKWKGKSCGVLDTPEMRMVKRNQKNFSELKYKEDLQKQAGKRIQVADDLATKRARRATDIASDLNYKGIRGKVDQMEAARMTLENEARQQQIRSQAPAQSTGTRVGRTMPRYRADPGSVFDIEDPTDIEYGSSYNHHYDTADDMDGEGSDYELLANWDPKKVGEQTSSWKSYLTGSYKRAYAPGHVMKYQEGETQQALQNVGYESSFYGGSNMQTPAPVQEEQVEFISVRALYDYTAADDDEVSFQEGDIISQAQEIGGGWLFGVVERTGASGMLPGNYVQQI